MLELATLRYFTKSPNAHFILVCRDAGRSENLEERAVIEGHLTEQVKLLDLQKSDGWAIVHPAHLDPQISWPSGDVSGMEMYIRVMVFPSVLFCLVSVLVSCKIRLKLSFYKPSVLTICFREHSHMTSDVFGSFLTYLPTLIRYHQMWPDLPAYPKI